MEHRTKRIIAHTAKNLLSLLAVIAVVLGFGIFVYVLKEYFQLTDAGAFVATIFPALMIGGVWLCWVKAKDDVATLEHKEALTMERLRKEH